MTKHKPHKNGFHELEVKLDGDYETMKAVQAFILGNPDVFVSPTAHLGSDFQAPMEITGLRVRYYFDTSSCQAFKEGIEIRQEQKDKGQIKQTVKISGKLLDHEPLMNRFEHACTLKKFGVDFRYVKDDETREMLQERFNTVSMKPVIVMKSQRVRLLYHPKGNRDILIEAGLDYPCTGRTFMGYAWDNAQLELEIVKGPQDAYKAYALLQQEAARFSDFNLRLNPNSKPTPGFQDFERNLKTYKNDFKLFQPTF